MAYITIVSEDDIAGLIAAAPQKYGTPEALEFIERASGLFEPEPDLLRETIDAVFWASLSEEEGKPALARVLFGDIRDPYCRLEPCEVTPDALRKLSPLLDASSNALLVRKDARIVGLAQWINRGVGVVAHRPGRVAVLDGSVVLGVFEKGNWVIVGGSRVNFDAILQRALTGGRFSDRFLKATLIVTLAMEARRAGRGATLVIVPATHQDGIGSVAYRVEDFPALPKALEAWRRARAATRGFVERDQMRDLVGTAIAIVAAGAGIDGATLIDDANLQLLGFGAKINAPDDNFDITLIDVPKSQGEKIDKEKTGGMRHQTAARLVYRNRDAMVITVSQDGPVSFFAWDESTASVIMIKHLDRYLEAEPRFAG
jgi:hypothetical protein